MIDFQLSPEQLAIRNAVRAFAQSHLKTARSVYEPQKNQHTRWEDRFRATQPIYAEAVRAGLIKAQIPKGLGGAGGPLVEAALVVEEFYAVETSASLTILGTGLGLTPLIMAGSPEQHQKFFKPFLEGTGTPLASLVFSEPHGSANFAEPGAPGFQTVAKLEGDVYVINGEKVSAPSLPAGREGMFADMDQDLGNQLLGLGRPRCRRAVCGMSDSWLGSPGGCARPDSNHCRYTRGYCGQPARLVLGAFAPRDSWALSRERPPHSIPGSPCAQSQSVGSPRKGRRCGGNDLHCVGRAGRGHGRWNYEADF